MKRRLLKYCKKRRIINKLKRELMANLDRIEIKLHRFCFSGPYKWADVDGVFGIIKKLDPDDDSKYNKFGVINSEYGKITVELWPKFPTKKIQCLMRIVDPSLDFLYDLSNKLPKMTPYEGEYTVDLFFKDKQRIQKYFRVLYRYIWLKWRDDCYLISNKHLNAKSRTENAVFKSDKLKMYERGPDDKEKKRDGHPYWESSDVDRIRIEYTASNDDFENNGLRDLKEFVKNPKFFSILNNKFEFSIFTESNRTIKEFDNYCYRDKNGHSGAFTIQRLHLKKKIKNIRQYVKDEPMLYILKKEILKAIKKHEDNWISRYYKKELSRTI